MYLQFQSKSRFIDLHLTSGLHDWDMNEEIKLTTTTDQFYHGKRIVFQSVIDSSMRKRGVFQCGWCVVVWQMISGLTSIWRSGTTRGSPEDLYQKQQQQSTGASSGPSAAEVCSSGIACSWRHTNQQKHIKHRTTCQRFSLCSLPEAPWECYVTYKCNFCCLWMADFFFWNRKHCNIAKANYFTQLLLKIQDNI